jgi:hypothetical protein
MSQFRVFQYVVFHQEPTKKDEQESKPTIIKEVSTVIAKSEDLVRMQAVRELTEEWAEKLENIVIAVRAF